MVDEGIDLIADYQKYFLLNCEAFYSHKHTNTHILYKNIKSVQLSGKVYGMAAVAFESCNLKRARMLSHSHKWLSIK